MFAAFLAKLSQTPLILLASVLAALLLAFGMIAWRQGMGRALVRYGFPTAAVAVVLLLVPMLMNFVTGSEQAAERQALLRQAADLDRSVLTPGSILACVDGGAGETVGNACEKTIFATAQTAATAVAYISARIDLLNEARALAPGARGLLQSALAGTRRTVTLDRYGIAAHVLAERDGCTVKHCAIFTMLDNVEALKSNLRAQVFDQYVSRYAASWGEPTPAAPGPRAGPAISELPPAASVASATEKPTTNTPPAPAASVVEQSQPAAVAAEPALAHSEVEPPKSEDRLPRSAVFASAKTEASTLGVGHTAAIRPGEHWDFPSADSIPAVNIMVPEPKLSKDAAARLAEGLKKAVGSKSSNGKGSEEKLKNTPEKKPKHPQPGEPLPLR